MPARRAPSARRAAGLLIAVRGAAGEVEMDAVPDRPGLGDRQEAHAGGRVLAGPDDDLVLPPGQDLPAQAPASRTGPGRAGRKRQRRCGGARRAGRPYARHAGPYPGNPLSCRGRAAHRRSRHAMAPGSCDQPDPAVAREPSQLSTWPDGKTITESNRILAYLCKISAPIVLWPNGRPMTPSLPRAQIRAICTGQAHSRHSPVKVPSSYAVLSPGTSLATRRC